jgi:hypothetical protein
MLEVLDLPEASRDLGPWLDRLIVSPRLAGAVNDLSAIHDSKEEWPTVDEAREWLGSDVDAVLERGLGTVTNNRLRQLLVRPALLPAIQELVFVDGGEYWNRLVADSSPAAVTEPPPPTARPRWLFTLAPLVIAASIAAFVVVESQRDRGLDGKVADSDLTVMRGTDGGSAESTGTALQPWGWSRPGVEDRAKDPAAVPILLADALEEWFRVTSTVGESDVEALRPLADELWAGCERALALPLQGMAPELRQRLQSQILLFQRQLQAVLRRLDESASTDSPPAVTANVKHDIDALVGETANALRRLQ